PEPGNGFAPGVKGAPSGSSSPVYNVASSGSPSPLYSGERGWGEGVGLTPGAAPSPPPPLPRVQGRGEQGGTGHDGGASAGPWHAARANVSADDGLFPGGPAGAGTSENAAAAVPGAAAAGSDRNGRSASGQAASAAAPQSRGATPGPGTRNARGAADGRSVEPSLAPNIPGSSTSPRTDSSHGPPG